MHPKTPHDVPCPPGNTCDSHGTSESVGSCRGGIKGSTFSRSSEDLSACRSSFRGVSPTYCTTLTQSKGVLPVFPDLVPLVHPSPRPTAGDRPHSLHSLIHWRLTSHTSISRVPPHWTRCHISRLPQLGSPFLRASLCRKQARREAITSKSPSAANETNCLAVDRTTSVSLFEQHSSHLQCWF
jgi:hypothetical protein